MAKKNKKKNPDEETLKHYKSYSGQEVPAGIAKPDNKENENPPEFVKADLSVDKIMSGRRNAVIVNPPPEKASDA